MKQLLLPGGLAIADGTNRGTACKNRGSILFNRICSQVRTRHETVNKRFKQFGVLGQRFRHRLRKHGISFTAVANLAQLMIQNGHPHFSINK